MYYFTVKDDNLLLEKPLIEFFSVSWQPFKYYPDRKIFNKLIDWKTKCYIEPVFERMRRIHHLNMRNRLFDYPSFANVLSLVHDMGFKIDQYSIESQNLKELKLFTQLTVSWTNFNYLSNCNI